MNLILILLFSTFISGCASIGTPGMQSRTIENYYTTTGVEKYFLADVPSWVNFDQKAACYRKTNIRYFDIDALMKSYRLSYNKAIQIQAAFNDEYLQFKKIDKNHVVTLKEEEFLFYKVSEKVSSKIIFFDPPTFKRINLVWLDEILGDQLKENKMKKFLNSKVMEKGVPVLVSLCLTRNEIENLYPNLTPKMITAELFSVYSSKGEKMPGFKIELDQFFKKEQEIYFYSQKDLVSIDEVKGVYKILNY